MALALPLLAGLVLAPVLGGRWSGLARIRIRFVGLFYAAIALQLVAFPFRALPWRTPDRAAVVLWLVSYALFAAAASCNLLRLPGMPLVAGGTLLNLAAILTNGGHMPALPSALRAAGLHFEQSRNSAAMASPHLSLLVDRFAAPAWVPFANVFSVGDVLIAAGGLVFVLVATGSLGRLRLRRRPALAEPALVVEPAAEPVRSDFVTAEPRTRGEQVPRGRRTGRVLLVLAAAGVVAAAIVQVRRSALALESS